VATARKLELTSAQPAAAEARIGGGALIGGIAEWPASPFGNPLVLVASLPASFLTAHAGIDIGPGRFASVFTTYTKGQYFLDQITYHGDSAELALLRKGTTQVWVHDHGSLLHGAVEVPAHGLDVLAETDPEGEEYGEDDIPNPDSLLGGEPRFLQEENLALESLVFALQLYGGDLPEPFRDLFYLTDGVGYLYLPAKPSAGLDRGGLFFVQVT
jgi:hypothetical protein